MHTPKGILTFSFSPKESANFVKPSSIRDKHQYNHGMKIVLLEELKSNKEQEQQATVRVGDHTAK